MRDQAKRWASLLLGTVMAMTVLTLPDAQAAEVLEPALEQRVTRLTEELRCLVCQNQTIADSHAELAIDLRNQVREKLAQGLSDGEVLDYMVVRYGDFVLYRPPVKGITWALWFGPFLLLVAGLGLLFLKLGERKSDPDTIDQDQLARAATLLSTTTPLKDQP